jgi:AraC-like DNA-binding protein
MLKQYLSYSGLRRIFLGVFISIFLGVNAGSFALYAYFSSTLLKEINTSTLNMLTKVMNGTELIYNEITSLMLQLTNGDITITRMMFESDKDRLVEYQGHQTMQKAVVSYPYIEYLAIYNERLNEIMATKDLSQDIRKELKELTDYNFRRYPRDLTIPIKISLFAPKLVPPRTANTITLILYSPLSLENDKGALILGINCDYFQQLLGQMDGGELETIMILHSDNRVISHPDGSLQLLDFSGKDYVSRIKSSEDASGFFIQKIDGTPTCISFTKSRTLGWTFISMIPYKKMIAKLNTLRYIVLLITFIILCAGVFVSYRMAVTMYSPIQRILKRLDFSLPLTWFNKKAEDAYIDERIDYLRSTANKSKALMRNMAILELLKNQYTGSDAADARIPDDIFRDPYHLVCMVSINAKEEFEKLNADEQGIVRLKFANIGAELLGKCCKSLDYAALEPGSIAFVLHLESGAYPGELVPLLLEIGVAMQKYCGYSTSAAIGSIVDSIFAINDSYEEAEKLIKERFFSPGKVFMQETAAPRKEIAYPQAAGDAAAGAILSSDRQNLELALNEFMQALEKTTYDYAQMHLNTLITEILSYCLSRDSNTDANSFHNLIWKLRKMETFSMVRKALAEFCNSLAEKYKQTEASSPCFIKKSLALIETRYGEPVFSVNTAAEVFNITPAYFNRLFKKSKGLSFSEYLNNHRMEMACKLLLETSQAVGIISAAVGITNTNYFYTLFKKNYNLTPQQFRINHGIRGLS